jgi:hypothetical protein
VLFDHPVIATTTLLRRASLDARLAAGEDPQSAPDLALRARQLCDLHTRRALGRDIVALLNRAGDQRWSLTSAIPRSGAAIDAARPALTQIAIALRSPEPVRAQGVARVLVLLRDGNGPLYVHDGDGSALYVAARDALLAMRPCAPCTVELVER